jgi:hypothetical protein
MPAVLAATAGEAAGAGASLTKLSVTWVDEVVGSAAGVAGGAAGEAGFTLQGLATVPKSLTPQLGTTVQLTERALLNSGEVIPAGSRVTVVDNTMKVVRPDGSSFITNYANLQKALPGAGETEATTVIGRVKDLQNLGAGEKSLLDRLPNQGNPQANWQQNSGVLRQEMNLGLPIRDASPGDTAGQFLNAERNLLSNHGWTFDTKTNLWMPPKK